MCSVPSMFLPSWDRASRRRVTMSLLVAAAAAAAVSLLSVSSAGDAQVNTTSGALVGHAAPNRTAVTEFLGIQYAQAPVGALRFAAPKRYAAPTGSVYEASSWASCRLPARVPTSTGEHALTSYAGTVRSKPSSRRNTTRLTSGQRLPS